MKQWSNLVRSNQVLPLALLGLLVAAAALISKDAVAQEGSTTRPSEIEEILVTAQRREERVLDVPVSISVMIQEEILRRGIEDFEDYAVTVPGLSFGRNAGGDVRGSAFGDNSIVIRGIAARVGEPTVALYLDDSPVANNNRTGNPELAFFDAERIEVLRGPQGTLYGARAVGGVVKVVTRQPDPSRFEGMLDAGLSTITGGGDGFRVSGVLNVPLTEETLALRISGAWRQQGGFVDIAPYPGSPLDLSDVPIEADRDSTFAQVLPEDVNDLEVRSMRAVLRYQPNERLVITPSLLVQRSIEDNPPVRSVGRPSYQVTKLSEEPQEITYGNYGITIEYDFGGASLVSSSNYFSTDFQRKTDVSGTNDKFFGALIPSTLDDRGESRQFVQELRLASMTDGRLEWLVGAFYSDREEHFAQSWVVPGLEDATGIPDLVFLKPDQARNAEELGVFGSATFHATDKLALTAGLRWFDTSREDFDETAGVLGSGPEAPQFADENGVTPRFVLQYDWSDNLMTYAQAARGFRPGFGIDPLFPPACDDDLAEQGIDPANVPSQVDSDSLWSYEIGAKGSLADNRIVFTTSIYQMDWEDIQQAISLSCGFGVLLNAGEARSRGAELELGLRATERIDLGIGAGFTEAEFTKDAPLLGISRGQSIIGVPRWNASASAQYTFPLRRDSSGYLRADWQYTDERPADFSGFAFESFSFLNLRAGVELGAWEGVISVDNVLNEIVAFTVFDFGAPAGETFENINTPRRFGLTVRRRF